MEILRSGNGNMKVRSMEFLLLLLLPVIMPSGMSEGVRVFMIGLDGLGGETYFPNAKTPVMSSLIANGTSTLVMQDVITTSSSQNWMSMIAGSSPDQHGVYDNLWQPGDSDPTPTIFAELKEQRPNSTVVIYHEWEGFGRLVEPGVADVLESPGDEDDTIQAAISYVSDRQNPIPDLMFIHLDHVDATGHTRRWGSNQYYEAVTKVDSLVGDFLEALEEREILQESVILISSDHGGNNLGHGPDLKVCRDIPLILYGNGIKSQGLIGRELRIFDIAVTVAEILGLKASPEWTGRPIYEALQGYNPGPDPIQKLFIRLVNDYEWIYDTTGSTANAPLSIWKPKTPSGYISSPVAVPGLEKPSFASPILRFDPAILTNPTGLEEIWNNKGSRDSYQVSIWNPTPRFGFTPLGNIAIPSYGGGEPSREEVFCLKGYYFLKDDVPAKIWDDTGSGANWDGSLWGTSGSVSDNSKGINLFTFFARRDHEGFGYNKQHWLNPDRVVIEE